MQIGLFFGSFNPIHIGHLLIAQYLLNETNLQQVWMVVSPHNPLKEKSTLAKDYDRLHLVRLATEDNPRIKVSDIEFSLPKPSYTVDTLEHLKEKYPEKVLDWHFISSLCQLTRLTPKFGLSCVRSA